LLLAELRSQVHHSRRYAEHVGSRITTLDDATARHHAEAHRRTWESSLEVNRYVSGMPVE